MCSSKPVAFMCLTAVSLSPSVLRAENLLHIADGGFRAPWPIDLWSIEVADWTSLAGQPDELYQRMQRWAVHGVNAVGISLEGARGAGRFFNTDGTLADPDVAKAFSSFTYRLRDHHFGVIVNLFSSDRDHRLTSPEAYRRAAESVLKLLGERHSCVFVIGDLFGDDDWPADRTAALHDPDRIVELAHLIKELRDDAVVAFPAAAVSRQAAVGNQPLFYAAQAADVLARLLRQPPTSRPGPGQRWAVVMAGHLLRSERAEDGERGATTEDLHRVREERLRQQPPLTQATAPPTEDILTAEEKAEGWVPLFDGRSFDGWTTLAPHWGAWSIADGTIHCAGGYSPWLRTLRTYGSFVLRLEFRIAPNGNSGVFLRAPLEARASRFGMEMQIRGSRKPTMTPDTTGAIYAALAPREDPSHDAGQWNRVEITCRGSRVKITINNRVVQDFDMDEEPAVKTRLKSGRIGLQDHGDEVWFRRLRIKQLSDQ